MTVLTYNENCRIVNSKHLGHLVFDSRVFGERVIRKNITYFSRYTEAEIGKRKRNILSLIHSSQKRLDGAKRASLPPFLPAPLSLSLSFSLSLVSSPLYKGGDKYMHLLFPRQASTANAFNLDLIRKQLSIHLFPFQRVRRYFLTALLELGQNLLTLLPCGGEVANHVEGVLGEAVTLAGQDGLEGVDGVLEVDELALDTGEDLGDSEGLAQETLDLTGTLDGKLVGFGKFVHTENGDDVLQGLVFLEDLLDAGGGVVVLLTDDTGVQHTRLGVEGVDGGVDTQLGNTTGQDGGGVQVGEGGSRGGVGQIVSRHVDGLDGGDGTLLGSGDTLLHTTHVDGEGGLVTDGRGDTTQQGRHLGTGLSETEDVVDEEEH